MGSVTVLLLMVSASITIDRLEASPSIERLHTAAALLEWKHMTKNINMHRINKTEHMIIKPIIDFGGLG